MGTEPYSVTTWFTTYFNIIFGRYANRCAVFLATFLSSFLKTGVISANLRFLGNWQFFNILSFDIWWSSEQQISDVPLSSFAGMLYDSTAFFSIFLRFFLNVSQIHFSKFKARIEIKLFDILLSNFFWVRISKSIWNPVDTLMSSLSNTSLKKLLGVSATFWPSEIMTSEKKRGNCFPECFVIFYFVYINFISYKLLQRLFCFLTLIIFCCLLFLRYLISSSELCIIAFLSVLVIYTLLH